MTDEQIRGQARRLIASTAKIKPSEVADVLAGKLDHTPLFKHAYGSLWKQAQMFGIVK